MRRCRQTAERAGVRPEANAVASATLTSARPAPKGGSCVVAQTGTCFEFAENPLGFAEGVCKDLQKGTYSKTGCPTENLMAVCDQKKGDKKLYYLGSSVAPWPSDAVEDCEKNPFSEGGKLTLQPNVEEAAKQRLVQNGCAGFLAPRARRLLLDLGHETRPAQRP